MEGVCGRCVMKDYKSFFTGLGLTVICIFIGTSAFHIEWYQVFYCAFATLYYYGSDSTLQNVVTSGGLRFFSYIVQAFVVFGVGGMVVGITGALKEDDVSSENINAISEMNENTDADENVGIRDDAEKNI